MPSVSQELGESVGIGQVWEMTAVRHDADRCLGQRLVQPPRLRLVPLVAGDDHVRDLQAPERGQALGDPRLHVGQRQLQALAPVGKHHILARELGLTYVNTGLMYRALTAAALRMDVDLDDGDALANLISRLSFTLSDGPTPELEVEGWSEAALTARAVEGQVSRVARHPQVRELMRALQRRFGERSGAVMEGRDIGSVVFPDAPVKIFLEADATAREARRVDERAGSEAEVATALHARDARDAVVSPFVPAADAYVIDTTEIDPSRTLARALAIARERL